MKRQPLKERFWSKVARGEPEQCWLWLRWKDRDGYGKFQVGKTKNVRAHRMSWQLANGPIPDGLQVLHQCDNPSCVNPGHLFIGTNLDNVADKVRKGRCGTSAPGRKLTDQQILEIRARSTRGDSPGALSVEFGVGRNSIWEITRGLRWTALSSACTVGAEADSQDCEASQTCGEEVEPK